MFLDLLRAQAWDLKNHKRSEFQFLLNNLVKATKMRYRNLFRKISGLFVDLIFSDD